ncbi:MAG: ArgE/DapE family deacylase [Acidimicrobiales bacterium]
MTISEKAVVNVESLAAAERAALAEIDVTTIVRRLGELVGIKSIPGTPGEAAIQHWYHRLFEEDGLETDFWPIDLEAVRQHPEFPGTEVDRTEAWGLVGYWGGADGPTLILNGHVDVVPAGDRAQWTTDPFEAVTSDGFVYGRGTCDMKGGLLAAVAAVEAIQRAGIALKGRVLLHSVIGEEDGGLGTFSTVLRGHVGDAAVILEPTSLDIVPACSGALTFRLHLAGRSTHAGLRTEGVSVVEKFWPVWNAINELEARRNAYPHPVMADLTMPCPISIGVLRAGQWASSVPDELVAEGRYGVALGETPEAARAEFDAVIAELNESDDWFRTNPVRVEWFGGQFAASQLPEGHPFLDLVASTHADLHGALPKVKGVPWASDLRLLTDVGKVPTLHYGPGDLRVCHAVNEYVAIDELEAAARTVAALILRFCGYEEPK